jgi:hypothetical protein
MSTVTEIIEAVKSLGVEEKSEFLSRLSEVDFDEAWDRQIATDVQAGRWILYGSRHWKTSRLEGQNLSTKSSTTPGHVLRGMRYGNRNYNP